MRSLLDGLSAWHHPRPTLERTREKALYKPNPALYERAPVLHPVIAVNPRTGRRQPYVNANFTIAIDGLEKAESDHWLRFLFDHVKSPEFQLRYRVRYRVVDNTQREVVPTSEILLRRDFSFNDQEALSKESEEALLYRDMQTDAVQQLLRRLQVVKATPA